jgi:hypothetical protein
MKTIPFFLVSLLALVASVAAFAAGDPLVGTWANLGGAKIAITTDGTTYTAKYAAPSTGVSNCKINIGDVLFTLTSRGGGYYDRLQSYQQPNCTWTTYSPETIKIDVVGKDMQIRCASDATKTCESYTRLDGADTIKPFVLALPSNGKAGGLKVVRLLHKVSDDSSKVELSYFVYKGSRLVDHASSGKQLFVGTDSTQVGYVIYFPKSSMRRGTYRFCIQATDAGHNSARSCSSLALH